MQLSRLMPFAVLVLAACTDGTPLTLDDAGERFVRIGLELGEYDTNYIDSYVGPAEWQAQAKANLRSTEALGEASAQLLAAVAGIEPANEEEQQRRKSLLGKLRAMDTRIRMLNGESFTFAEEARLILDVGLPVYDFPVFDRMLAELDARVPGEGSLAERVDALKTRAAIPGDRLDAVFNRAIEECRRRTAEFIDLPDDERFRLEYVSGMSWSGYLEYLGDHESLMSINTDNPITTARAVDLGCHEGYPGHHVYNLLVDRRYLQDRGWVEFQLQPLYAPAMLVHEGSAEYGVKLAFSDDESLEFQRDVLAGLAGLDPDDITAWHEVVALSAPLADHAISAIARRLIDGGITREEAIAMRQKYLLETRDRAERGVRFIEEFRTYVLNYSLGEDIVAAYVEKRAGDDRRARWDAFVALIDELPNPSDMVD